MTKRFCLSWTSNEFVDQHIHYTAAEYYAQICITITMYYSYLRANLWKKDFHYDKLVYGKEQNCYIPMYLYISVKFGH